MHTGIDLVWCFCRSVQTIRLSHLHIQCRQRNENGQDFISVLRTKGLSKIFAIKKYSFYRPCTILFGTECQRMNFFVDLPKINNFIFWDKEKFSLTIDVHIK